MLGVKTGIRVKINVKVRVRARDRVRMELVFFGKGQAPLQSREPRQTAFQRF